MFRDRAEAGRRLAARLAHYKGQDAVVFALPRGGVPVAEPIAAMLHAPLDLVLARKIGVPRQPELAMGAVADGGSPVVVRNEDVIAMAGVDEAEFDAAARANWRRSSGGDVATSEPGFLARLRGAWRSSSTTGSPPGRRRERL